MCIFNCATIKLEDVAFYTDKRLDHINVYSIKLLSNSDKKDEIDVEFVNMMKKYSYVQLIQESSNDWTRFTIVSHVSTTTFSNALFLVVCKLKSLYKCKIVIL